MTTFLLLLPIIVVTAADVAHLAHNFLPQERSWLPSNERVETTIEKHEVIELPTQIEVINDGQPIYGVRSKSTEELLRMSPMAESMRRYMQPSQEIANLQQSPSGGVPYEMATRSYLPPVLPQTTTNAVPFTTTQMPMTTTDLPITSTTPMIDEEPPTRQPSTLTMTATEMAAAEHIVEATTIPTLGSHYLPPKLPTNHYLPPTSIQVNQHMHPFMLQTQYLNPTIPQDQYLPPVFVENDSLQSATAKSQNPPPVIPHEIIMQIQMTDTQNLSAAMPRRQYLPPVMAEDRTLPSRTSKSQHPPPPMLEEHSLPTPMIEDHIPPSPMPKNQSLLPSMPETRYLPPTEMMLPPPPPMPQPTYQQYQEQLVRDQQKKKNSLTDVISQMEDLAQMQPVAPVEPSHSFSEDGYHYKTDEEDLSRFRYRR